MNQLPCYMLCLGLMMGAITGETAEYFASPTGVPSGDGSINRPWDIHTVLLNTTLEGTHPIKPGDLVWLRGGSYPGKPITSENAASFSTVRRGYAVQLNGTPTQPIVIRNYQAEAPLLDGLLTLECDYCWFWGLEITLTDQPTPSSMSRAVADDLINRGQYRRGNVEFTRGREIKLINCVIHGNYGSGALSVAAIDAELYGNVFLNNGRMNADYSSGHGLYVQNESGTKRIVDNIIGNCFLNGINLYSASTAPVNNVWCEGNFLFGNGHGIQSGYNILAGSSADVKNIGLVNNVMFYRPDPNPNTQPANALLGYDGNLVAPYVTSNCLVNGGLVLYNAQKVFLRYNEIYPDSGVVLRFKGVFSESSIDYNRYQSQYPVPFDPQAGPFLNFSQWKSHSGQELNSSFTSTRPLQNQMFVRPNKYERGRGHIAVVNWQTNQLVNVDVQSLGLTRGERYIVRVAQDYYGRAITNVYDGSPIALPMVGWNVDQPRSLSLALLNGEWTTAHPSIRPIPSTFPHVGVFVILPVRDGKPDAPRILQIEED